MKTDDKWIEEYYNEYQKLIVSDDLSNKMINMKNRVRYIKNIGGKIVFAGNGASNTIATHGHLDFMNQLGIPCISINDGSYLTATSNDFGYENVFERYVDLNVTDKDMLVLISSSGRSKNVINAAKKARLKGADIVTFSGFKDDNPLRKLGNLNFWVDSERYNIVESIHNSWLVSVVDLIARDEKVGIHGIEFNIKGIDNNE